YAVGWQGPGTSTPNLRVLLLADVDMDSAGRLTAWALRGWKVFDMCVVCGDFIPRDVGWTSSTEEELIAEEGQISATLAQLENIVSRVVYVPGPWDPLLPRRSSSYPSLEPPPPPPPPPPPTTLAPPPPCSPPPP
ncbi:unnamed protein product, partial [Choristocarpus tenellus]